MKTSIRNKNFTLGMVLFLIIILFLSVFSVFYLTKLSKKTAAILKENHYSVVYARDMAEQLTIINQKIVNYSLLNTIDTVDIDNEFVLFNKSLLLEKNNITEIGEDTLVSEIELSFMNYRNSVSQVVKSPTEASNLLVLQKGFENLYQQLMLLSLMNEKAIEAKTDDAKVSAKKYSIRMSFIGAFCFLIAYAFTFSLTSYFNDRFFNLYTGIKEVAAGNSREKLYIDGADELAEISLIFNQMAEKLHDQMQNIPPSLKETSENEIILQDVNELRKILLQLKVIEIRANQILSSFDSQTEQ
ncbi:MAG TPA: hypothetical protein DCQ26_12575 [Marinilabiliales bacterium]|nr:MAG: hypothetical protein A2W95_17310 [Bacteroidetes bacterium GWA2_40_14]OFX61766.1 MAG: hypothetical protein A2W84_13645 [Bacteroidetes bacterium GWC2_40_13]OFX76017.1 MAG: hypothetical protein A2W96_01020 [Bacteroidetes bacterium GWD2_40_43]OFX94369.1 MAG: hypothetical protein A2W97_19600 [Bacteroidetes bacterium GWE2_40_63]OFY18848.1 MAG: hypothetical protein A2W88_06370 [Bacteroidetes bacterium GWF2_40_13]OFZ24823.1 MAG: hypothetical protein A2437_15930 [Bacteroidetes bacterium RIFOXYC